MTMGNSTGKGEYTKPQWDEQFRQIDQVPPSRALFDIGKLKLMPLTALVSKECEDLLESQKKYLDARRTDIVKQAHSNEHAIQPVLDVLNIGYAADPEAKALVKVIVWNISYPLFRFKAEVARARPRHRCPGDLERMFEPPHKLHPGHGSYPSGHATLARCWAELIGHYNGDPTKKKLMIEAADDVALNREVAGLHFPSDSVAGKDLGQQIANLIIDAKRVTSIEIETLLQR